MTCRARCGPRGAAVLLAVSGTVLVPACAHAFPDDVFNISVGSSVLRDDNLFRITDALDPRLLIGASQRGDTVRTVFVALNGNKRISRQQLSFGLTESRVSYANFGFLDDNTEDMNLAWTGAAGRNLKFGLRAGRSKQLEGFSDSQQPVHNLLTRRNAAFNLDAWFAPRWSAGVELAGGSVSNGLDARRGGDNQVNTAQLWLRYTTRADNRVELRLRQQRADYPNVLPSVNTYNSSRQDDVELSAVWQPSGWSTLSATLGRRARHHKDLPERDFSATYGSLAHDWTLDGAWSLRTALSRDVGLFQDSLTNYAQTDTLSIQPRWLPTAKIGVYGAFERRRRRYLGSFSFDPGLVPRAQDTVTTRSLTASYLPWPNLDVSLTVRDESRASSNVLVRYDDRSVNAAIQYTF